MCAIVGVFNSQNSARVCFYSLFALQHRGQEASGIATVKGSKIYLKKGSGFVNSVFSMQDIRSLDGQISIGHNRYSTSGKKSLHDAQPLVASCSLGDIAIAHNGNLINKDVLRKELIRKGAIFQSNLDTENIIHLIARSRVKNITGAVVNALESIKGAYCLLISSKDKMFAIRDRYGVRPLSLGRLKDGGYIVASETCAFNFVQAEFIRDIRPGEMLIFSKKIKKPKSIQLYEPDFRLCAFEYIYFARPDSVLDKKSVYATRVGLGKRLAIDAPSNADIVMPVPDSGIPASIGYSRQSGLQFDMSIVRSHYIGRTFIEPLERDRKSKVELKLSPIKENIRGKRLVVVDDSIVRGITSKRIVKLLRRAGAKEIHMRISSPPVKYPCKYGIDTPTKDELISSRYTKDQLKDFIGADSLEFLSIDSLTSSLGSDRKYSLDSFNGDYFIR